MIDLRILNTCIITMDVNRRIIKNGGVAIDKGIIIDVGESDYIKTHYHSKETICLDNHILIPGLIDTHSHAGHSLLTTTIKDTIYWMNTHTNVYNNYLSDEYWKVESKLANLQRLKAGITTSVSVMGSESMCYKQSYVKSYIESQKQIGLRNIICCGPGNEPWPKNLIDRSNNEYIEYKVEYDDAIRSLEEIVKNFHNTNNGLTKIFVTPYKILSSLTNETDAEKVLSLSELDKRSSYEMRRIASKYKTRIHTDAFKGMVKLASSDENALLGEDVHLQHCQGLSFDEVKILAETKTSVSFWPTISHFKSKAPIIELMGLGVKVSISSDAPSYTSGHDLFTNMRRAQLIVRALYNDRDYLPNEKVLEMVTIDAASVIGMESEIGSIEIGKKADIVGINIEKPKFYPRFNPVNLIVRLANINDVNFVMCNGNVLMNEGKTKLNEEEILIESEKFAEKIIRDSGLDSFNDEDTKQWGKYKAEYSKERLKSLR